VDMKTVTPEEAKTGGRETAAVNYVPHVVAWNLTRRCNLECAHCYISAGPRESATAELETAEALRIVDQLLAVNPAPLVILSGGEPLLRHDLTQIAAYATQRGATVVVGTNGTCCSATSALRRSWAPACAASPSRSIRSRPSYHDNFRHGRGSLEDTIAAVGRLRAARLDFIIQTTATKGNRAELERLAQWSAEQGAVAFNCYFLVATGRGAGMSDLAPAEYDAVLADLARWQREYRGQMMIRAKCAPHFMRHVHAAVLRRRSCITRRAAPAARSTAAITPTASSRRVPTSPRWRATSEPRASARSGAAPRCSGSCGKERLAASAAGASTRNCAAAVAPARIRARGRRPRGRSLLRIRADWCGSDRGAARGLVRAGVHRPHSPVRRRRARLDRIRVVRGVVAKRVEDWARERGLHEITPELLGRDPQRYAKSILQAQAVLCAECRRLMADGMIVFQAVADTANAYRDFPWIGSARPSGLRRRSTYVRGVRAGRADLRRGREAIGSSARTSATIGSPRNSRGCC